MADIIKFNSECHATGIASPRFQTQQVVQNLDQDLFIKMLENHPEHIARAKDKLEMIRNESRRKLMLEKDRELRQQSQMIALGALSSISLLVATIAVALLLL